MTDSTEPEDDCHAIEDAVAAFRNLSDREKDNVMIAAKVLAGRGNIADAHELVNEAYVRIAEGVRRWPRSTSFARFLVGVVKSLATDADFATDAKKIRSLSKPYAVVTEDRLPAVADIGDSVGAVHEKEVQELRISRLEAHFQGDNEMQLLLMGIREGLRGRALEELMGADTKGLEALRTRFKRQCDKMVSGMRDVGPRS